MAAIQLTFDVPDPAALVAAGWDEIKVERSTDGGTSWAEVSRATTRIPLRDVVERYCYADSAGATTYSYRAVYHDSVDGTDHGVPLSITDIAIDGYATVAEIRAEGVTVADAADARVELALEWATRYVERATRRRFGARYAVHRLDVRNYPDALLLPEPVIAVLRYGTSDTTLDPDVLTVYNRHLRGGDLADLASPKVKIEDDLETWEYMRRWMSEAGLASGSQTFLIAGLWGYTEPTRGAVGGETAAGSQVPLDYGVVPPLVNWATRALTLQHLFPMYTEDDLAARARQVTSIRTRDQAVTFSDAAAAASSGWAGSDAIAEVLAGYGRSISFGSP
jgi:hypothetical protein